MLNLMTAFYTHFTETTGSPAVNNAFYSAISGRMYNTQAPETATLPYAVYQLISDTPSWNFHHYFFETLRIQVDLFSSAEDDAEIEAIYTAL